MKENNNKLVIIHRDNNIKFCMKKCTDRIEYQVKVGREIYYSHWDFDTAVKEYQIIRKERKAESKTGRD